MKDIKYKNALDENDNVVSIEDVTPSDRELHSYTCIGCGDILIPKLGDRNAHHFSHKPGFVCNPETYLHKLAKKIIKETWDSKDKFYISYKQNHYCDGDNTCPFFDNIICTTYKYETFDLKKYYDICSVEEDINGFVADILISNSKKPKDESILIEIAVTHKNSQQKNESGLKIIEIKIENEDDAKALKSGYIEKSEKITFYNFKDDSKNKVHLNRRKLEHCCLYKSGETYINQCNCREETVKKQSLIFEAMILRRKENWIPFDIKRMFLKKAIEHGVIKRGSSDILSDKLKI